MPIVTANATLNLAAKAAQAARIDAQAAREATWRTWTTAPCAGQAAYENAGWHYIHLAACEDRLQRASWDARDAWYAAGCP